MRSDELEAWWRELLAAHEDRSEAIHMAYQQLKNAKVLNRVTVGRYLCERRGCVLGTIIRVHEDVIARTEDYKLATRANASRSVEAARKQRTLDGERHWPGHTYDVLHLAEFGLAMDMSCRCQINPEIRTVLAADVLDAVKGVIPGHPGPPMRI